MNKVEDLKTKEVYYLPNWVINNPCPVKVFETKNKVQEEDLEVLLVNVFANKTFKVKVANTITIEHLKEIFCKTANLKVEEYRIRFLYKGQELKGNMSLATAEVKSGERIQAALIKL